MPSEPISEEQLARWEHYTADCMAQPGRAGCDDFSCETVAGLIAMIRAQTARIAGLEREHDLCVPEIDSEWWWEPLLPHAERVVVTAVRRNDDGQTWIESTNSVGAKYWNELSRWVEATVLAEPRP